MLVNVQFYKFLHCGIRNRLLISNMVRVSWQWPFHLFMHLYIALFLLYQVVDPNDECSSHTIGVSTGDFASSSIEQHTANLASFQTFICIITDLTDASNTCKRHVINLSGSYTVDYLIQEAANFYLYEPWSFNLFWRSSIDNEMVPL